MTLLVSALRRSLWMVLLAAAGGAAYSWWRDREGADDLAPAEWPPLEHDTAQSGVASSAEPLVPDPSAPERTTTTSVVNALVDAPEARSTDRGNGSWVEPLDDGSCPITHPIKANDNSGIFHVPDGRSYERTNAERCYTTPEAAVADGYRQAKN